METAIEYLLKSGGVLSIFVLVYHFLLRRLTFFNANRWFLLAGIAASILFPLVEITQTVYVEQAEQMVYLPQQLSTPMASVLQQPTVEDTVVAFDYAMLFFYLYVAISIFFIGKMVVELSSLRRLIRSGDKKRSGKFVIVTLSRKLTPFSFFNYICYSTSDQQSPELDLILEHEKVHAREWHSIDLIVSHLFKALFWINPLVWLLKRQIGENLEFIADSKAKVKNTTAISYERTLLSAAASHMQPALANNFFTPFIKKRIVMLQKEASANWNAYKYALILPVIVLFLYSFNVVEEIEYVKNENALQMDSVTNNNDESSIIDTIENATTTSEEEVEIAQELWSEDPIIDFDHTINFSIEPTSTEEYLEEKKTYLKKEYNVDFNYSKFKIKRGKIVRIKISLDDNNGYKGSQEYSATGGIKSICVKGVIKGDSKSWSMGGCKTVAVISENSKIVKSIQDSIFYTIQNADKVYTDSIVQSLYQEMKSIENDSVKINYISASRSTPFNDSLVINKSSLNFNDPNTIYTFESSFSNRPSTKAQIKRGFYSSENPPLTIVNGKKTDAEITNLIDPKLIKSLTELKDKEATSLYGNAAKNGVVLITTKNTDIDNRQDLIMSKKQEILKKRAEMKAGYAARRDSLISKRTEIKEARLAEMKAKRDNSGKDGVYSGYAYNNGAYFYVSENGVTAFYDISGNKRFIVNKIINPERDSYKNVKIKGKSYNFSIIKNQFTLSDNKALFYDGMGNLLDKETLSNTQVDQYNANGLWSTDEPLTALEVDELNRNRGGNSVVIKSEYQTDDMSKNQFERLKQYLEDAGHTFRLKTHRMKNNRLVKLKFHIDGSQYAYQSNTGYKELKIVFKKGSTSPSISMIPYK